MLSHANVKQMKQNETNDTSETILLADQVVSATD